MKKSIIITTMMALLCGAAFAQPTGEQFEAELSQQREAEAPSGSLSFLAELDKQAEPSNDVRGSIDRYISAENIALGLNGDGLYFASGFSKIKKKPTDKDFELARNLAYLSAMADAKKAIAHYYGQSVETKLISLYTEPTSADLILNDSEESTDVSSALLKSYKPLIDKELQKRGFDPDSAQSEAIIRDILALEELSSSIRRASIQQVGGLVVDKLFEQDGEIGLIAYYSPVSLKLAGAINGAKVKLDKVVNREGPSVSQWIYSLGMADLYLSQGIQLTSDKDGNIVVISYALSSARSESLERGARTKANLEAVANIRRFAGELVVTNESKDDSLKTITTSKESMTDIETRLNESIELRASKMNISGITEIRQWKFVDPRSNTLICGSVCMWSIPTAQQALTERAKAKWYTTNRGGFNGDVKAVKPSSGKTNSNTPSFDGDADKYKGESPSRPRF